tara:strand:+ start:148 stop:381 length:234 start_codon:yes stop_codon:yes gene_type:complete
MYRTSLPLHPTEGEKPFDYSKSKKELNKKFKNKKELNKLEPFKTKKYIKRQNTKKAFKTALVSPLMYLGVKQSKFIR